MTIEKHLEPPPLTSAAIAISMAAAQATTATTATLVFSGDYFPFALIIRRTSSTKKAELIPVSNWFLAGWCEQGSTLRTG
jgi:hypothetical protein